MIHCLVVVDRRDKVVEDDSVSDLPGELHHLHTGCSDVDGHVLGPALLVDVVELDAVEMDELAVVGDVLVGEQGTDRFDGLTHREQGLGSVHADLARKWLPPGADPQDHTARSEVVQGRERRCEQCRVPRPVVHHAGAHLDPLGDGKERRHRHRRLTHEPALCLPDRMKPLGFRVTGDLHSLSNSVRVLQVDGNLCTHGDTS